MTITSLAGEISPAQIKSAQKTMRKLKTHPRDSAESKALILRLEQCYAMARLADREQIQLMLVDFQAVLDRQIPSDIERMAKDVKDALDRFEGSYVANKLDWPYDVLKLDTPPTEKRAVKRAYAKQLKMIEQAIEPDKFQRGSRRVSDQQLRKV